MTGANVSALKDYFISYNRSDRGWAEWIAWQLESEGLSVILQAWDFRPGSNFALEMDGAATQSMKTLAVLSPAYLQSHYTAPEWANAFARDATGRERRLVPVRVHQCELTGLLAQVVYIDLVDLDEADARHTLLSGIREGRAKPQQQPTFPGVITVTTSGQPAFPAGENESVPAQHKSGSPVDAGDTVERAIALIPEASRSYAPSRLGVVVAAGPKHVILRPSRIEAQSLRESMIQRALFGDTKIFDVATGGIDHVIKDNTLLIRSSRAAIGLDEFGSLAVFQALDSTESLGGRRNLLDSSVLVEEDVSGLLTRALLYIRATLDDIDPQRTLQSVVIMTALLDAGHRAWRTRAEHYANPNTVSLPSMPVERAVARLSPPVQDRARLHDDLDAIIEDFLVQLRREVRAAQT